MNTALERLPDGDEPSGAGFAGLQVRLGGTDASVSPASPSAGSQPPPSDPTAAPPPPPPASHESATAPPPTASPGSRFAQERVIRDEVVRKATIAQLRQGLMSVSEGMYEEKALSGFDLAATPKSKLFRKATDPAVLGRYVALVDGAAMSEAWDQAGKWPLGVPTGVVVFLIGGALAPAHELADAIGEMRRKARAAHVTVVPVHASDFTAHMPMDAPALAKTLIARFQRGGHR